MTTPPNLRQDAFVGTASAYLRYRPPYPKALLDDLLVRTAAPPTGALLDLACGPGRVPLELAPAFESVWAIDLESEMIDVAKQEAARRGISHVNWRVGRAEELALPPCSVDLITIGEAFHRLDQRLIAHKALAWLRPGGCLATLGTQGIFAGREAWQIAATGVARRWSSQAFPSGWAQARPGNDIGPGADERVLRACGFIEVESRSFAEPRDWSLEAIVGYLRSTSVCSEKALGQQFAAFEAELRSTLTVEGDGDVFHENMQSGYTVGRKRCG
jgi:SAM-dependent methyltransferase